MVNSASFWKPEICGQTVLPEGNFGGKRQNSNEPWLAVLPDSSILKEQKFVENAKIKKKKSNETFLEIFKQCA